MKGATVVLGLLVVVGAANALCPMGELFLQKIDECKESTGASDELIELVTKGEVEGNRDVMCFQACLATQAGLDPKNLDIEKVEGMMRGMAENPDEDAIKTIVEALTECKEEAETSDDECVVASNYFKCLRNAKKGGK